MKTFTPTELADRARTIRFRNGVGYPGGFNKPGTMVPDRSDLVFPPATPNRKRQAQLNGRLNGYDQLRQMKSFRVEAFHRPGSNNSK